MSTETINKSLQNLSSTIFNKITQFDLVLVLTLIFTVL